MTADQYRALQHDPIVVPGPEQLFEYIVEILVSRRLFSYADADPFRSNIPAGLFLLVPARPEERSLDELLSLVVRGAPGRSFLLQHELHDSVTAPAAPYLMVDVDDGRRIAGQPPVAGEGRSPYSVWEGIVHAVLFPMVFESHDLVLQATEYGPGAVPTLCLNAGRPELRGYWYGCEGYPRRGVPTCSLRVGSPVAASPEAGLGAPPYCR